MKQTRMRILSLLLALVMCLGMLPATVLAEETEGGSPTTSESEEQKQPDDTTNPENPGNNGGNTGDGDLGGENTGDKDPGGENSSGGGSDNQDTDKPGTDPTTPVDPNPGTPEPTIYTITFNANGGTATTTSVETDENGILTGLPTPTRDGYNFKGWFNGTRKVQEGEKFTDNATLTAQWEAIVTEFVITFNAAGGTVTPSSAKTGANGRLTISLPTPVREGYIFTYWTSQYSTAPVSNSTVYDRDQTLTAMWQAASPKRIDFSPNGGTIKSIRGYSSSQIPAGSQLAQEKNIFVDANSGKGMMMTDADGRLDSFPVVEREGYTLQGWYSGTLSGGELKNPVKWNVGDKAASDLTLYALWQSAGEDTYDFSNSSRYIDNYKITDKYFDYLTQNENPTWKLNMRKDFYEFYDPQTKDDWGGSCFGMSAVYCMARGGAIDLSVFQSGAKTLRELKTPRQSANIQDLINYYMMAQSTTAGVNGKLTYWNRELTDRYSRIVSGLSSERGYSILGFNFSEGGHAIVARSIQKGSDGNYHVEIWDSNAPDQLGELVISSDYTTARFSSGTSGASSYNVGTELKYIMPLSTRSRTYDSENLQSVFGRSTSTSSRPSDAGFVLLSSSVGDFTVTTSDGRRAVVKNGTQTSGDLTLLDASLDGGPGGAYRFYIQASNLGEVTITLNGKNSEVRLVSDDILADISSDALDSVVIGDDKITTSCPSAAQQTVTLASETLGATWNAVTVTGKDTGLTLDAGSGTLKVSSRNNVSVQVQGENIDSQKSSSRQTVTASSAGTSLTVNSLGFATQQPVNPFVDVTAGTYYYDAVLWAVENSVTGGTSATTFSPNDPCTRAQIVTFLWRAAGSPKPAFGINPFTDVQAGAYYYDAVLWAVEKSITGGTSATTFSPNDPCTRGQTVSFLWRAAGSPRTIGNINSFADVTSGAYYASAVQWAVEKGITSGLTPTSFGPDATVTRGQTVTFLYRSQGK